MLCTKRRCPLQLMSLFRCLLLVLLLQHPVRFTLHRAAPHSQSHKVLLGAIRRNHQAATLNNPKNNVSRVSLELGQSTSSTTTSIAPTEKDDLIKTLQLPLEKVYLKIKNREFQRQFKYLNDMTSLQLKNFQKFTTILENRIRDETNYDIKSLSVVNFISPNLANLPRLVRLIHLDHYPRQLLAYHQLQDKQELLTYLLTRTFYQYYEKYTIQNTPFESKEIDFSNPTEWFPEARKMKRKIVMHVGPTNSGKTYRSLVQLSKSKTGYYAGPLRLLAREIWERFNKQGVGCNLITGEEIIPSIDEYGHISGVASGTIEMIPLHKTMDLCVIDEIQMIQDEQRGSVWTNAVLGVLAREIHLCGEESAVPLIEKLVKYTGDDLEIKRFKRMGKLTVESQPVDLYSLKKGDCLVAFAKRKILEYKSKLEKNTNLRVGVVYGGLPPEIRAQEAEKFNTGKYDVLVASDAVGMGLNLKIKRIVFSSTNKYNGTELKNLTPSQVKQIAGRAGRFSVEKGSQEGFVTALTRESLVFIKKNMDTPIEYLSRARIWPSELVWKHYMANQSTTESLYETFTRFLSEKMKFEHEDYELSEVAPKLEILQIISDDKYLRNMTINDQFVLAETPINLRGVLGNELIQPIIKMFLQNVVDRQSRTIFEFPLLRDPLIIEVLSSRPILKSVESTMENVEILEAIHKLVLVFLWLSQRYSTLFIDKQSATELKALVEKRLSEELRNLKRINNLRRRR